MTINKKAPVWFILLFSFFVLLITLLMQPGQIVFILRRGFEIAMLMPKGIIALKERNLLFFIQVIMLLVIIPVYILTFIFSWKYRAHNAKAKYTPDWSHSTLAEALWWGIPCFFTIVICVVTWISTYDLDPYRPVGPEKNPLKIQVVALQWKWLFLYPDEKIATINYIQFPEKVPVNFEITADAPMNSFWIPQLGGQIYAMPKMKTQLNLIADAKGVYRGSSANISGLGFAGMVFNAEASSEQDYKKWVEEVKAQGRTLDEEEYNRLAQPSQYCPVSYYRLEKDNLFDSVLMKYMAPQHR